MKNKKSGVSSNRPGLQTLIGRMSVERFLRDYWPCKPVLIHAAAKRLQGFIDIPEFASIDSMLDIPCKGYTVQNRWRRIFDAEGTSCRELYDWGFQIYMQEIKPQSRSFENWLVRVETDLGLPPNMILPNLFFCKRGSTGSPPWHFDPQEGFTVHIRGTKRWFIAENQHIAHPTFNYKLGEKIDKFKQDCFPNGPPSRLRNVQTMNVKPGSIIFFPRGAWHTTRSTGDSVHLDLMIPIPTWQRVLQRSVIDALDTKAAWRAPVITSSARSKAEITTEMADMLRDLARHLDTVDTAAALHEAGFPVKRRR